MARAIDLNKFYEQPFIFIIILALALWVSNTDFYSKAGQILINITITGVILWILIHLTGQKQVQINGKEGNTPQAMMIGIAGVILVLTLSSLTGLLFFGWETGTIATFWSNNKASVIGATSSPLQGNIIIEGTLFLVAFVLTETVLIGQFALFMIGKTGLSLKNPRVWVVAFIMGFFAVLYHIFAKSLATGQSNENVLMVIFYIFFVEVLMIAYTKEYEPALWHHFFNNAFAMGLTFTISYFTNFYVLSTLVVLIYLANNKKFMGLLKRNKIIG